jgi:hypothetical protein
MARDPNMPRWIMASCRQWFETNKLNGISIFYEYTRHKNIDQNETVHQLPQYAEFRLNGPDYKRLSGNEETYSIEINVLLSQDLIEGQADTMEYLISYLMPCFTSCIPVYRYGDPLLDAANDNSLIGGLLITDEKDGQVNIYRFGQANPDTLFSQTALEVGYRMHIQL